MFEIIFCIIHFQFKKRKEFQDHIREHKDEAIRKAKKDIRSTLMLNKCGILIDEYERDFKGFIGKPLPLKILGYLSVQEMAENMTDVINMIKLSDGTIMLQAVPDESTTQWTGGGVEGGTYFFSEN